MNFGIMLQSKVTTVEVQENIRFRYGQSVLTPPTLHNTMTSLTEDSNGRDYGYARIH